MIWSQVEPAWLRKEVEKDWELMRKPVQVFSSGHVWVDLQLEKCRYNVYLSIKCRYNVYFGKSRYNVFVSLFIIVSVQPNLQLKWMTNGEHLGSWSMWRLQFSMWPMWSMWRLQFSMAAQSLKAMAWWLLLKQPWWEKEGRVQTEPGVASPKERAASAGVSMLTIFHSFISLMQRNTQSACYPTWI